MTRHFAQEESTNASVDLDRLPYEPESFDVVHVRFAKLRVRSRSPSNSVLTIGPLVPGLPTRSLLLSQARRSPSHLRRSITTTAFQRGITNGHTSMDRCIPPLNTVCRSYAVQRGRGGQGLPQCQHRRQRYASANRPWRGCVLLT